MVESQERSFANSHLLMELSFQQLSSTRDRALSRDNEKLYLSTSELVHARSPHSFSLEPLSFSLSRWKALTLLLNLITTQVN